MIDFSSLGKLGGIDISMASQIDPFELFGKLGVSEENTKEILKGDFSSISKPNAFVIDLTTFYNYYGKIFNLDLIKYLLYKAKNGELLTEEEKETYKEGINLFFKLAFKAGTDGIFIIDEPQDECLLLKHEKDYFILIKSPNMNNIFFLPKTSK